MSVKEKPNYLSCSAPKLEITNSQGWSPKKQYFEVAQQLEKARRRVQLLKIENEIREKKLQVFQQKNEQWSRIREDQEQYREFKQSHKEQVNDQIKNLVSRTRNLRQRQSQEKLILQQGLIQMRQSEVKTIKEQSQRNEQLIRQNLDQIKQQKYEQKQQVLNSELMAQQTIKNFRDQRYFKFLQEHQLSKSQHSIEADIKMQQIEELRRQEAYLKIKLDETIQVSQQNKLNMSSIIKQSSPTPKTASNFYY